MTPLLELANVSKTYRLGWRRTLTAVDGATVSVHRGQVLGVVGESGSGKSTLARMILGMEPPTAGAVRFDGQDLATLRGTTRTRTCRRIQMIFQDPGGSLNPRKSTHRVLHESLALAGTPKPDRPAATAELLHRVGLGTELLGHYPHELSGGQRQRLAIARAMAVAPDLLVADEPVSALDVSLAAQIMRLLLKLRDDLHLTLVFISHDLALVHHLCDHVIVMQSGTIVERGPPAQVLHHPRHAYTRLLLDAVPKGANINP